MIAKSSEFTAIPRQIQTSAIPSKVALVVAGVVMQEAHPEYYSVV